jgi:CubicO group peptidase (beta-lactamase class C family)
MQKLLCLATIALCLLCACQKDAATNTKPLYFPPLQSDTWESITPESLSWQTGQLNELYDYLSTNRTRAFIVLKDGRLVLEKYWGNTITNTGPFGKDSRWYWASAGKTITATLIGITQQEKLVDINKPSSNYLGQHWTSMPLAKENEITVRHQLTMSTGLDYNVTNQNCTDPACLKYRADAGTQWYYHNAPYALLQTVIAKASGISFNSYTDQKLEAPTGMNGTWIMDDGAYVYWSTAREMARFGLLIQNKGNWNGTEVLSDKTYFEAMTNTSQTINPSYGYLWWLNGKSTMRLPGSTITFNQPLASNAPADLVAGAGKNGQFVDVVPSKGLVVVRMGEAPDSSLVPIQFHNEMWAKLGKVLN